MKTANLLDTTDGEAAAVINPFLAMDKLHWRAIQDSREAVSQAIGRAIQEVCFSGLIAAPSFAGKQKHHHFPEKAQSARSVERTQPETAGLK